MIGFALIEGWLVADKTMINREIPQSSDKFQYVAYITTNSSDAEVEMIELGKGWKSALDTFQKKTEDSETKSKAKVAIIGHTGHQQWWNIKTALTGLDRYSDVY